MKIGEEPGDVCRRVLYKQDSALPCQTMYVPGTEWKRQPRPVRCKGVIELLGTGMFEYGRGRLLIKLFGCNSCGWHRRVPLNRGMRAIRRMAV